MEIGYPPDDENQRFLDWAEAMDEYGRRDATFKQVPPDFEVRPIRFWVWVCRVCRRSFLEQEQAVIHWKECHRELTAGSHGILARLRGK